MKTLLKCGLVWLILNGFSSTGTFAADMPSPIRVGMIGLDTSHVDAFTDLIRDAKPGDELRGMKILAFMEAADLSKQRGGAAVTIRSVMDLATGRTSRP